MGSRPPSDRCVSGSRPNPFGSGHSGRKPSCGSRIQSEGLEALRLMLLRWWQVRPRTPPESRRQRPSAVLPHKTTGPGSVNIPRQRGGTRITENGVFVTAGAGAAAAPATAECSAPGTGRYRCSPHPGASAGSAAQQPPRQMFIVLKQCQFHRKTVNLAPASAGGAAVSAMAESRAPARGRCRGIRLPGASAASAARAPRSVPKGAAARSGSGSPAPVRAGWPAGTARPCPAGGRNKRLARLSSEGSFGFRVRTYVVRRKPLGFRVASSRRLVSGHSAPMPCAEEETKLEPSSVWLYHHAGCRAGAASRHRARPMSCSRMRSEMAAAVQSQSRTHVAQAI